MNVAAEALSPLASLGLHMRNLNVLTSIATFSESTASENNGPQIKPWSVPYYYHRPRPLPSGAGRWAIMRRAAALIYNLIHKSTSMTAKQFAAQMKIAIEEIKAKGNPAIPCDNLISYLEKVQSSAEPDPSPVEIERFKADLQNRIETNKMKHESDLEMFRSVIASGQAAIKSSFLLNGGAAVAMLAFIGHLAQFKAEKVAAFAACLVPFAYGVLAIAVTSGVTYLTQWFYASDQSWAQKVGFWLNLLCIILGLASYALFAWGLLDTYRSFVNYA